MDCIAAQRDVALGRLRVVAVERLWVMQMLVEPLVVRKGMATETACLGWIKLAVVFSSSRGSGWVTAAPRERKLNYPG